MTATNEMIMKADRRGRLRYTTEQKAALMAAFDTSGVSGPRFAAIHGVNYQTFAGWLQKRKRGGRQQRPGPPCSALLSLVPAELAGEVPEGRAVPLELHLPGGAKLLVRGGDQVRLAAALLRQLQQPLPC